MPGTIRSAHPYSLGLVRMQTGTRRYNAKGNQSLSLRANIELGMEETVRASRSQKDRRVTARVRLEKTGTVRLLFPAFHWALPEFISILQASPKTGCNKRQRVEDRRKWYQVCKQACQSQPLQGWVVQALASHRAPVRGVSPWPCDFKNSLHLCDSPKSSLAGIG